MSFFKPFGLLTLVCAVQLAYAQPQEMIDPELDDAEFAKVVVALAMQSYLNNPKGEINPRMEYIVGYTDTGVPITNRRKGVIEMGKRLAKLMLEREEKLVREGKMKPRKRPLTWEQREALIAEQIAKHGPITTKTFIIPGTTPEQSEQIHQENTGIKVTKNIHGHPKDQYVLDTDTLIQISDQTENIDTVAKTDFAAVEVFHTERRFEKNPFEDYQEEQTTTVDEPTSAEEIYKSYFPDEFKTPIRPISWIDRLSSFFVSKAFASELDPRTLFTEKELKEMRKTKKAIEEKNVEKTQKDLLGTSPTISPEMMNKAKEMAEVIRSRPLDVRPAIEVVDHRLSDKLTAKNGVLVLKEQPDHMTVEGQDELTFIFISYSLSDKVLMDIFKRHQNRKDVQIVMRGIPDGQNIATGVKRIQNMVIDMDPQPNVIIDPTLFTHFSVKSVPTVVRASVGKEQSELDRKNGHLSLIAKVEGLHNDQWLLDRIEQGHKGDLGQQGTIYEIAERDMIEEMKERVAKIDWSEKKEAAIKRFWGNQTFVELSQSRKDSVRELDPSVIVTQDMKDANGLVIHKAGTRINPLAIRDFNSMLVIFDPTDPQEREIIDQLRSQWSKEPFKERIFIASKMDKEEGWDAYEKYTDWLDAPLYLLMSDVARRFHIKSTPTLVTADNDRDVFLIEEIAVPVKEDKEVNHAKN